MVRQTLAVEPLVVVVVVHVVVVVVGVNGDAGGGGGMTLILDRWTVENDVDDVVVAVAVECVDDCDVARAVGEPVVVVAVELSFHIVAGVVVVVVDNGSDGEKSAVAVDVDETVGVVGVAVGG